MQQKSCGLGDGICGWLFCNTRLYADKFFGFFYGPPTRFNKFIDTLFMTSDGIFGIPLYVASTYIVLFIIFGSILIRSGVGRFFVDLSSCFNWS